MYTKFFGISLLIAGLVGNATCVLGSPDSNVTSNTTQNTSIVQSTGSAQVTTAQPQIQQAPVENANTPENASALSTKSSPLQENLKKELDEINQVNAAQMREADKLVEASIPFSQLVWLCDKLKAKPFSDVAMHFLMLGNRYYCQAIARGKYQDAIKYNEWLLQACQAYKDKFSGSRVSINRENVYLADLSSLNGDYDKAEQYCKQYFASLPEANKERSIIKQKKNVMSLLNETEHVIAKDMAKVKSLAGEQTGPPNFKKGAFWAGTTDLAMARINYGRGNYDKSAEFLAKAKALSDQTQAGSMSSKKTFKKAAQRAGTKRK